MKARLARILPPLVAMLLQGPAWAGAFGVSPIRIDLDRSVRTGLITLTSDDDRKLYFQLKLFEWTQTATGEDEYRESGELVFFPQILTLEPKDTRLIRVGLKAPPAPVERAFRLFIEELPEPGESASSGAQIAVRLRFGVPIFLTGAKVEARPEIAATNLSKGAVRVAIRNSGDRQIRFEELLVLQGEKFVGKSAGWYVFPGVTRSFTVPVAREDCPASGVLEIRAVGEGTDIRKAVEVAPVLCQP